ncbi:MAG TPA: DinB family protein [Thermoanaerobaculia bacterium]|nr:DinB family protein [Thermoanaerobaculia bacterium]
MKARIALLATLVPIFAFAQNASRPAPPVPPRTGFHAEFFANLDEVQDKIMELAEGTPADKFAWRPANDVRSIAEVYMHVAGGNYFLSTYLGVPAPKPHRDLEKTVTKKADVIAELQRSFNHLRAAAAKTKDLEKKVKLFDDTTTHRGVLVTVLSHLHEHLGQSIAYARMNGIAPPWSR